jgi:hypothetical protein
MLSAIERLLSSNPLETEAKPIYASDSTKRLPVALALKMPDAQAPQMQVPALFTDEKR